jgi:1-acyl-sn-glycerol-3-phosphate acyltransferase
VTKTFLDRNRLIRSVIDRNFRLTPGLETVFRAFGCTSGGRDEIIKLLERGHLVGIAPGGGYEAQLGTSHDYAVMWKERRGFAVVAKEAGVPIIPMFTENIREAVVNMQSGIC